MEKAADLEILAEKLVMVPKEELIYISGRVDSYADMQKRGEEFAGQRKGSGITHEPALAIEFRQKKSRLRWFRRQLSPNLFTRNCC